MCLLLKLVRWLKVKSNKLQKKFLTLAHICFSCMLFLVEQPYLFSFRLCIWRLCFMTIWRLNYTTFIKLRWLLVTRFLMQAHLAHMKLLFVETKSYCTFLSLNRMLPFQCSLTCSTYATEIRFSNQSAKKERFCVRKYFFKLWAIKI